MADLYSVIPGLQPSAQDILEAELLAKQILEAKYPTLDLREGTGLRDLLIRPLAVFVALTKNGLDYITSQNSISNVDNQTPPDLVDSILSNWFLTRKIGTRSVISSRLYFSRKKNVSISTDIYFSTDNVLKFYPTESATYTADGLVFDSFSNEYYVDVDLTAEKEGSSYNVGSGSLLYFSNFDPYFLRAEINYLKEASIESESNTEFINRAKTAISTRNLINQPSIDSNLRETFNYIKKLVVVGMGDPQMIRDVINASFPASSSVTVTGLTTPSGGVTTITATAPNNGFTEGQLVQISGATPAQYNCIVNIQNVTSNNFAYTPPVTPSSAASILPVARAIDNPIPIHNGGMVDIYCSNSLATAIVQVTTDSSGQAHLTGPIYEITRSTISGGSSPDTIPQNATFTTTQANTMTLPIKAGSCSGTTVTITTNVHPLAVGRYVVIKNASNNAYNGTWRISSIPQSNTFTFNVPNTIVGTCTGGDILIVTPWYDYGFSQRQDVVVDMGIGNGNGTASFQIKYFQYLDSVQEYLDSSENRVVCADYLARGFNFYLLSITVTSYNGPAPNSALVNSVISNYLDNLAPGDMFVVSDMMTQLRLNGIVNIQNPPNITFKLYNRDLVAPITGTIKDVLDPDDSTNVFLLDSVTTNSVSIDPNTLFVN